MYFKDRIEAGRKLAKALGSINGKNAVIYALPRGGVVVGAEIAKAIEAQLDLIITRKIGHPYQPEYAIGAIAENGHFVLNENEIPKIDQGYLISETERQKQEIKRRREVYLRGKQPISCKDKIAILVDDGIATGLTIKAAIRELKAHYYPQKIIAAVPVVPKDIVEELKQEDVEVVSIIITPEFLGSIGAYYQDFAPVSDEEVIRIMKAV